jgi:hypothetical protein
MTPTRRESLIDKIPTENVEEAGKIGRRRGRYLSGCDKS